MDGKANPLARRKFLALLVSLLLLVVVYPILRDLVETRLLFDTLVTLLFAAALVAVFRGRGNRFLALVLGTPTLVGLWSGYVLPGLPRVPLIVAFHLCGALFFSFVVVTILRSVSREKEVTADAVYGAFCGYLLVGLIFGHLFCVLETLAPGSFRASEPLPAAFPDEDRLHFLLTYFSFITLTTVGYGDVTPASRGARGLAVVEAIVGQFYIAVLMAQLIGIRVAQALAERQSGSDK